MAPQKRVGLLVGRENTFPGPFIETVNKKGKADGITAELDVLGGTSELAEPYHSVLVDRISHEVPYYRDHLENAVRIGAIVIHDPLCWAHDETSFEGTLARTPGVPLAQAGGVHYMEDIPH